VKIQEIKGESDHIHFLLKIKPTDRLSSVVGCLKSKATSFLYDKGYKFPYWGKLNRTLWSSGYFVCSTGGVSIETLEKYIQNQGHDG
jgi:putative transposase